MPDPYVDSVLISRDKAIYGAETISLPLKIKFLQDFYWSSKGGKYNYLIMKAGIKRIFPADSVDIVFNDSIAKINQRANVIKAALNDAMLEAMIDKWLDKGLNDKEITYTLPECEGSSILKKITDKYKGKYVFLDFWATYCGPCRAGIESSKAWREELRNNPDFEFVFITGDRSSPQAAYDEYVAQNLNGAECYRIPEKEYQKLWELFKFTGIPHYEALDPNGDVLTKFNKYYLGKEIFLSDIEMLKNMQK
jgi:thiol-disulfide isomerase/thioredoxin